MLCLVTQSCPTLCDPIHCSSPLSLGILQARTLEWVAMPCSGDLPNTGIKPRSLTLQADALQSEPPGKTKNAGVGSLSLLQQIFLTQESNWGLLHCRQILYQLSYLPRRPLQSSLCTFKVGLLISDVLLFNAFLTLTIQCNLSNLYKPEIWEVFSMKSSSNPTHKSKPYSHLI